MHFFHRLSPGKRTGTEPRSSRPGGRTLDGSSGKPLAALAGSLALLAAFLFLSGGPGRAEGSGTGAPGPSLNAALLFPSVHALNSRGLWAVFDDVRVVDVRTGFEFDVVHIQGSLNRPAPAPGDPGQDDRLKDLSGGTTLVFTGNDRHDTRPFRAALDAASRGISPVRVYADGVLAWADTFPDRAVLMGSCPAAPLAMLPEEAHREKLIGYWQFLNALKEPNTLFIDIRSVYDRSAIPLAFAVRAIPMEAFLEAVACRVWSEKTLVVLDRDDARLPWLHRFLLAGGYDDVLFLKGGTLALGGILPEVRPSARTPATDDQAPQPMAVDQDRLAGLLADPLLTGAQKRFLLLVISGLTHENYAVMPVEDTARALDCEETTLTSMADVLQTSGHVRYASSPGTLVFRVDPRLAWKGAMGGKAWERQTALFLETQQPWRMP
jgi:rhodanese-related sulfurtransferase